MIRRKRNRRSRIANKHIRGDEKDTTIAETTISKYCSFARKQTVNQAIGGANAKTTHRHTGQTDRHTDRQTDRHTHTHTHTYPPPPPTHPHPHPQHTHIHRTQEHTCTR